MGFEAEAHRIRMAGTRNESEVREPGSWSASFMECFSLVIRGAKGNLCGAVRIATSLASGQ
jgi:hypothetical protein